MSSTWRGSRVPLVKMTQLISVEVFLSPPLLHHSFLPLILSYFLSLTHSPQTHLPPFTSPSLLPFSIPWCCITSYNNRKQTTLTISDRKESEISNGRITACAQSLYWCCVYVLILCASIGWGSTATELLKISTPANKQHDAKRECIEHGPRKRVNTFDLCWWVANGAKIAVMLVVIMSGDKK